MIYNLILTFENNLWLHDFSLLSHVLQIHKLLKIIFFTNEIASICDRKGLVRVVANLRLIFIPIMLPTRILAWIIRFPLIWNWSLLFKFLIIIITWVLRIFGCSRSASILICFFYLFKCSVLTWFLQNMISISLLYRIGNNIF